MEILLQYVDMCISIPQNVDNIKDFMGKAIKLSTLLTSYPQKTGFYKRLEKN